MSDLRKEKLEQFKHDLLLRRLQKEAAPQQEAEAAILPVDRSRPLALSWQQQRLWFLEQLGEASAVYYINGALRLKGRVDQGLLQAALDAAVARHEALRTTFVNVGGKPVQRINAAMPFALRVLDFSGVADVDPDAEIARAAAAEAGTPFNLETGPLIRARLLRLAADDCVLLITMHHIISDGWSIGVLMREVGALYQAFQRGTPDPLPALTIHYADYAHWQQQARSEHLTELLAYWREHLRGAPALLELPDDHPRPAMQSHAGGDVPVRFDAALTAGLNALARRHGATLFMVLFAGWAVLLSRLSGQEEVVIGTPVANRPRHELEAMIGFFVNTLALRADLTGNPTVGEFIERIKAMTLAGFAHQEAPFEQVVDALKPERSLSHSPLFQVVFALQNAPMPELKSPEVSLRAQETARVGAHFDLTLSVQEVDGVLLGSIEYASDLFDVATIERWRVYLEVILREMVADEAQRPGELPLLSAEERAHLLYGFNATQAEYPRGRLIHELFEEQAARQPDAVALISPSPGGRGSVQTLTYGELDRRANQLAHHLRALGVDAGQTVAVYMERSPEAITGFLGILKAGGAYVVLNPDYPADRLQYLLADAAPKVVLTRTNLRPGLPATSAEIIELDSDGFLPLPHPRPLSHRERGENPLANIIYTSGSTGEPKGVMIGHRNVVNLLTGHGILAFQPDDCVAHCANLAFDASTFEIWGALMNGARLLILPQADVLDPARFIPRLQQHHVSVLFLTTGLFHQYVGPLAEVTGQLRHLWMGGEALDPCAARQALAHNPPHNLVNGYGPTETTTFATACAVRAVPEGATSIPIGRPLQNVQIYILDKRGEPVPVGVAGEIFIGGAGVSSGYLNHPELTAERFVPDPFFPSGNAKLQLGEGGTSRQAGAWRSRMYKTGDLGRWRTDGNIEYVGRNDFQVKLRGFRIELGEIEACLTRHPEVHAATVLLREDQAGRKRLVAYVATRAALKPEDLRRTLAVALPEHMIPAAFVTLAALPLTPNGKVDRRALPAPDESAVIHQAFEPPQGEMETTLAAIWREVLKLEKVGRHDNFFDLGGHSLLAVQVIEKLRQVGLKVDVRNLFKTPVLCDLALDLSHETPAPVAPPNLIPPGCEAITPAMLPLVELTEKEIEHLVRTVPGGAANVQDIYPLAPLQEGILFHHLMSDQSGDAYVLPMLFAFEARPRLDAFLGALRQVIARHDILRTAVLWEKLPHPVQVVYRHADLLVETTAPKSSDPEAELKALMLPENLRMDLRHAPLLQVLIVADPFSPKCYALLQAHHLVLDHVSLEIMVSEVFACLSGEEEHLPNPVAYRGFVAQTLTQKDASEAETFFRNKLGDFIEPSLPFGLSDTHASRRFSEAREAVPAGLARRLRQSARQLGVSTAVLFHAAWALVIARTSGCNDVVFGSVLSGRLQGTTGADRVVGMFINTLPLRLKLAGQGVAAFVCTTQRELVELIAHEQTPLALAQRASGMAGAMPLFSALLNYRHSETAIHTVQAGTHGIRLIAAQEATNYPFTFEVDDLGDGFALVAQVDSRIAAGRVTAYVRTALEELVDALENSPGRQVLELSILPDAERDELLHGSNAPASACPESLVHELFEEQARRTPDAVALISPLSVQTLTYGELDRRANQLAHYLRALGVGPDQPVAICVERSLEMVVGLLGILKAGGAYVPIDPAYPPERIAYMLADAAPKVILTQTQLRSVVGRAGSKKPPCQIPATTASAAPARSENAPYLEPHIVELDGDWAMIAGASPRACPDLASPVIPGSHGGLPLRPHNLAYIIYTSGSTGQPKGVMVEHGNVTRLFSATDAWFGFSERDVWPLFHSFAFDFSVWELWGALLHGGRLVIVPYLTSRSPQAFYELLCREQVTVLNQTPSAFRQLIAAQAEADSGLEHALRCVIFGGEALEPRLLAPWVERNGHKTQLINMYGITETTVHVTCHPLSDADIAGGNRSVIGRAIPDLSVYILDSHRQLVPTGVIGELYVGGAGVARGYLNRPELTAERFIADPFSPSGKMYKTGDLARFLPDGNLEYLGRNDFQVKIRGFRIEPGEIEAALTRQPGIREAVVLAREDLPGDKRLVAWFVPNDPNDPESVPAAADLRAALRGRLPEYMLPSAFIALDAFPLTPNGKLDRKALPAPDSHALASTQFAAPQNEAEEMLAALWADVLKLERVGRHDNFFDLGGHSLLAVQMLGRIREHCDAGFALRDLFEYPTLEQMAARMSGSGSSRLPASLVPLRAAGERRPLFLIHVPSGNVLPYVPLSRLLPEDVPVYGLQVTDVEGDSDSDSDSDAPLTIEALATRHIDAIRQLQPHGPYHLAGWSAGGLIAYEMAAQLAEQGEAVAFLGLFDTYHPAVTAAATLNPDAIDAAFLLSAVHVLNPGLDAKIAAELSAIGQIGQLGPMLEHCKTLNLLPVELSLAEAEKRLKIYRAIIQASRVYRPATVSFPVHLFAVEGDLFGNDPSRGWQDLLGQWLSLQFVSGTHIKLMEPPHVQALARQVTAALQAAEADAERFGT
ncbi:MAG: amino acid adenylation domain-containing protein [Acidobacteriota bacterium]|jgi:amino acid adenylation domain-containing protein|nr:amino acid adenylation domain-containing protein [Acidobacteriota bacterium]